MSTLITINMNSAALCELERQARAGLDTARERSSVGADARGAGPAARRESRTRPAVPAGPVESFTTA